MSVSLGLIDKIRYPLSLWLPVAGWCLSATIGFFYLCAYGSLPGIATDSPPTWPACADLNYAMDANTLLVFVHPQCPCTTATLAELERLLAEVHQTPQTTFVITCPSNLVDQWSHTSIANRCVSIAKGNVVVDIDGELAGRFNALNSGHCVLYSSTGELLFQGGLTTERGHEGESLGRVALRQILNERCAQTTRTPVFGCELVHPNPMTSTSATCGKETQE